MKAYLTYLALLSGFCLVMSPVLLVLVLVAPRSMHSVMRLWWHDIRQDFKRAAQRGYGRGNP